MEYIFLAVWELVEGFFLSKVMTNSGIIKFREALEQLQNWQLINNGSAPGS
jgi:hypothetical protein